MAKQTVLELVQSILSDMDSDEVNSINDTVEALQVAQILKDTYDLMAVNRNWPDQQTLFKPENSGTTARPTHMRIPDRIKEVSFINYDIADANDVSDGRLRYEKMRWREPHDFLEYTNNRNTTNDNIVQVEDFSGVTLLIRDDKEPQWYTSFDDEYVVFDSYDSEVDDTLKQEKAQLFGYEQDTFDIDDDFIPNMPEEAFPALLAEAKSSCFIKLKQVASQKDEQNAQRQQRWLSRKAWKVKGGVNYPDYGRRSRANKTAGRVTLSRNPQFDKTP